MINNLKIATLLPYKENYTYSKAQAAAIWVYDFYKYSINKKNGVLNWEQKINSNLTPVITNEIIFSISLEGYLFLIESKSGNIIRSTDIFDVFKIKKRNKIYPVNFIITLKNIYLTTNHGKLLIIDIKSGKTQKIIKIDGNKVSKPFISNNNIFVIKDNSIIRFD